MKLQDRIADIFCEGRQPFARSWSCIHMQSPSLLKRQLFFVIEVLVVGLLFLETDLVATTNKDYLGLPSSLTSLLELPLFSALLDLLSSYLCFTCSLNLPTY